MPQKVSKHLLLILPHTVDHTLSNYDLVKFWALKPNHFILFNKLAKLFGLTFKTYTIVPNVLLSNFIKE